MALFLVLMLGAQAAGGYARPELLVDTEWLAQHLKDPDVHVVDMRARGYNDGHIP